MATNAAPAGTVEIRLLGPLEVTVSDGTGTATESTNACATASAASSTTTMTPSEPVVPEMASEPGLGAEEDVVAVSRYIVLNPVRAALVRRVGDYPFWDAVWI